MDNFDNLPYHEKVFTLIKGGTFINSINFNNQRVDLYHLKGIFIEVFCHPVTTEIDKICIAGSNRLHLYSPIDLKQN